MKTYLISVCHTNPTVIFAGFSNIEATIDDFKPDQKILVDHHYPLNYWETKRKLVNIAQVFGYNIISPIKNLGAHKGFSWALNQINLQPDDIILGIDPDCNIVTRGWAQAMVNVFNEAPYIGSLSLYLDAITHNKDQWIKETIAGTTVGFLNKPEMFNVTGWRGDFLLKSGGLKALMGFYGHVEVAMRHEAQTHGFKQGYLLDYRETFNQVPHDEEYNKWKGLHVGGYQKNFDDYVKENNLI